MKGIFRNLFHIYPGEEKHAFLFAFLGFIWSLAITSGLKFGDALFLIHVGSESLPLLYTLTSCCMLVIASFLLYAFHTLSVHRIFLTIASLAVIFYACIYLCLALDIGTANNWLWFVLRIVGYIFFALFITCFWTFIDQYHPLQDAKRLFSLFSSMIFLGMVFTGTIMRLGFIDFQHMTLVIVALLLFTIAWIYYIVRTVPIAHEEGEAEVSAQASGSLFSSLGSILKSKFTLVLMLGNFLTYLLVVTTEFSYMSSLEEYFAPEAAGKQMLSGSESASLTQFLGQSLASIHVGNLIFGLFFYSRIVRKFGIGSLIPFSSLLLIFTFSGWMLDTSLIFPLLGMLFVEGSLNVIDDSNFNLLLNAVPTKLKYKIRVMIETFFEPIGMLTASLLLSLPWINSHILGLCLATGWLVVALILRKNYLKAIYLNLYENSIHFQRNLKEWLKSLMPRELTASQHRLLNTLKQDDLKEQSFSFDAIFGFEDPLLFDRLTDELEELPTDAKISFIQRLEHSSFSRNSKALDCLHTWSCQEHDQELKGAADLYLAKFGFLHPEKALQNLESNHALLKGAAILSLQSSWAYQTPAHAASHRTLAAQELQKLLESDNELDICMGLTVLGYDPNLRTLEMLLPYLNHSSSTVISTASKTIAKVATKQSERHATLLLSLAVQTSDSEVRMNCLKALGKMGSANLAKEMILSTVHFRPLERRLVENLIVQMGLKIVPTLLAILKDSSFNERCRVLAGRTLGALSMPQLRANLYEILQPEIERAYIYFYHSLTIQSSYPSIDLKNLKESLFSSFHSIIDFIIQLLSVAGEIEDGEILSRSLRSRNRKIRSQVVEALEKTCEPKIFHSLHPLVAEIPLEERTRAYLKGGRIPLPLDELLNYMSNSPSPLDQIMSATLKQRLNMPGWREALLRQMSENEQIFQHFAYELLEA